MQEEINKIKISMTKIETNYEHILEALDNNKDEHKEIRIMITNFIKASEKRFAPMWVAKVLIWGSSAVGGVLVIALLNLIIK